jgi:hypothetical protein
MKLLKYHGVLSSSSFVFRTFIIAGIVTYFVLKGSRSYIDSIPTFVEKLKYRDYISFCLTVFSGYSFWLLKKTHKIFFQMNYNPMGIKFGFYE